MKFFFPDSQDQIDPRFDLLSEEHDPLRVRQRDDQYAHEYHYEPPYDGILLSKGIVDGVEGQNGKYSQAQRQRLLRQGMRRFFRLSGPGQPPLLAMGDCGAFSYVGLETPPYTADEVLDFYEELGVDIGTAIDHIILGYNAKHDTASADEVPKEWIRRREITMELAAKFLERHKRRALKFVPMGVAQGWSPRSYAESVRGLQKMGYQKIALGGMVALKSAQILETLRAVSAVRGQKTQLHLFGVTRCEHINQFKEHGVTSFDSTSPFRQAFKDDRDNYHTLGKNYLALRVPQVDANNKLKLAIRAGKVDQKEALRLEGRCMELLNAFDREACAVPELLEALLDYERLHNGKKDRRAAYKELIEDRPWKKCQCRVCREVGIHVVVFRGSERNKRRGFHNLYVFGKRLHQEIA